jgi:hypothetical protein
VQWKPLPGLFYTHFKYVCAFYRVVGRVIFRVSGIYSETEADAGAYSAHTNLGADGTSNDVHSQTPPSTLSLSLEEVCSRVRRMTFCQQQRLLRHVLLARSLAQAQQHHDQSKHQQREQLQLQKAVVEEVLRAPRPTLLASLLAPPSSLPAGELSARLFLRLTVRECRV